jgi:hypothetical protein
LLSDAPLFVGNPAASVIDVKGEVLQTFIGMRQTPVFMRVELI